MKKHNDKAKTYCSECGGSGNIRTASMGVERFDFTTCPICKGKQPQQLKSTAFEKATQHWRKEFGSGV
ncbi:hypothetical protein OU798_07635 [Prolixibacteraceae bacterium Z1-6]|uniref:Uncharacterized protein n=1 Tax=Draconibacterium aestuarii TaxID=2998507 RepID=A0A9X3J497_9BACT|nr:hypothetical protein [Prolixibacteraceae bacterium Z1-6]